MFSQINQHSKVNRLLKKWKASFVIFNFPKLAFAAEWHRVQITFSTKFFLVILCVLSQFHNLVSTVPVSSGPASSASSSFSFPVETRQNWFDPPPPEQLTHEFELIKPRLLAIFDRFDHPQQQRQSGASYLSSAPYQSHYQQNASSHLLTFYTHDGTPFYAVLYQRESDSAIPTTTNNPYNVEDNQIGDDTLSRCAYFHGHLVTPSKGYLAVTTCPNKEGDLVMSATIMLNNGQVYLIRPPSASSPSPNIDSDLDAKEPRNDESPSSSPQVKIGSKAFAQRRRSAAASRRPLKLKDNCYMAEYEKRQVSIEDQLAEAENSFRGNKNRDGHFGGGGDELIDEKHHQLVHQFGRHYLYRLSDKAPNIVEHAHGKRKHSNYSSCTERYIDMANEDGEEVVTRGTTTTMRIAPTKSKPQTEEPEDFDETLDNFGARDRVLDLLPPEHRIAKREITKQDVYSKIFTIETIIFVDASLINRFNGNRADLQKLILAIMNEVQLIYNFDSLKIRIRVLIKQIVYLEGKDAPESAEGDIDQYLDNFCAWQKRLWMAANRTARWDHALMLTGLDLYKRIGFKKNRKVLGLAWVNGMCRPAYSCTLNEGKNFEASFVIAHEMAHSLGMLHDGYDNNCDPEKYIMSEKTGPGKINWSPCSNLYLENFLTKSNMRCLESTRADQIKRFSDPFDSSTDTRLPGEQYTLNQQCQLALGNGYKAYTSNKAPFHDVCRELWCSSGTWATPAHPALEGSTCGRRKSCYQGSCVDKQRAFAQSKIKMYNNRRATGRPSRVPPGGGSGDRNEFDRNNSQSTSSAGSGGPSFMRRVQRFLKNTIGSVVRFFG